MGIFLVTDSPAISYRYPYIGVRVLQSVRLIKLPYYYMFSTCKDTDMTLFSFLQKCVTWYTFLLASMGSTAPYFSCFRLLVDHAEAFDLYWEAVSKLHSLYID